MSRDILFHSHHNPDQSIEVPKSKPTPFLLIEEECIRYAQFCHSLAPSLLQIRKPQCDLDLTIWVGCPDIYGYGS